MDEILRCSYTDKVAAFEQEFGLPEGWTEDLMYVQRVLGVLGALGEYPPEEDSAARANGATK